MNPKARFALLPWNLQPSQPIRARYTASGWHFILEHPRSGFSGEAGSRPRSLSHPNRKHGRSYPDLQDCPPRARREALRALRPPHRRRRQGCGPRRRRPRPAEGARRALLKICAISTCPAGARPQAARVLASARRVGERTRRVPRSSNTSRVTFDDDRARTRVRTSPARPRGALARQGLAFFSPNIACGAEIRGSRVLVARRRGRDDA